MGRRCRGRGGGGGGGEKGEGVDGEKRTEVGADGGTWGGHLGFLKTTFISSLNQIFNRINGKSRESLERGAWGGGISNEREEKWKKYGINFRSKKERSQR